MIPRAPVLLIAAWVTANPLAATSSVPLRYAGVLGVNDSTADSPLPLAYADDDAARFLALIAAGSDRSYLLTTFDAESARLYPGLATQSRPPTREELARVLGEVYWLIRSARLAGRATELVFFFAGHGDVNDGGEGFVLLADGPFTRSELAAQVVDASPADVNHVILDACASYFMVRSRSAGSAESGAVALSPALLDVLQRDAAVVSATFNLEAVKASVENAANFYLEDLSDPAQPVKVAASLAYSAGSDTAPPRAVLTPAALLGYSTTYRVTLTTGVQRQRDEAQNIPEGSLLQVVSATFITVHPPVLELVATARCSSPTPASRRATASPPS